MCSERLASAAFAGAFVIAAGCSSQPVSYIVLSLTTTPPASITGVADIQVDVSDGLRLMQSLTYHASPEATIDQDHVNTLSVGFTNGETGNITFNLKALNSRGCVIGMPTAATKQDIKKGGTAYAPMTTLTPTTICTNTDAGTPEVPEGTPLPGCDPVDPQSTAAGVTTCTSTQTCKVDCTPPDAAPARNSCVAGGSGLPGTPCPNGNADCQPGTQCFDYTSIGCNNVKLCLRFCNSNSDCTAFGAGGAGPGSVCQGPVMCPAFLTAYHTCTFSCDPRAAAAASRGGCPTGLACVMPADMDQVDCGCLEASRTKREGEACASAADCAAGFICNRMSGNLTCRPICRCDANAAGTACTATTNDCPTAGTTCHAVTNNKIYGICLQ
jgi:hypothetical protein